MCSSFKWFASKVQPISSSESTLWDQCALIWRGQLIWSDKVVSPFWQITYQIGPTWGSWCLCTINKLIGLEFLNLNRYFPLRHIGHCPSNELEMCWNMATFFPYHIRSKCFVMLYGLSHVWQIIACQWDHRKFEYIVTITLQPYLPPSRHFTHGKVHQKSHLHQWTSKTNHSIYVHTTLLAPIWTWPNPLTCYEKMDNTLLLLPHVT